MNKIKTSESIYDIINTYPKAQEILVGLGFKPMAHMATVNTVGKVTSLNMAMSHLSLDIQNVKDAFMTINVEVINE